MVYLRGQHRLPNLEASLWLMIVFLLSFAHHPLPSYRSTFLVSAIVVAAVVVVAVVFYGETLQVISAAEVRI